MALWKNKEEYENWKIEKIEQAKRTAEELEVKRLRKKKLFICRYCSKEVRRTFLNCIRCPFCKSENPAPPLTKREKYECFYSNHCIYNGDNNSFYFVLYKHDTDRSCLEDDLQFILQTIQIIRIGV